MTNTPQPANLPSAEDIHAAMVKALHEVRDAIPAARKARRSRVEIAQAVENRIDCVKQARSYGMPFEEIAEHLGVSKSYAQKLVYRNAGTTAGTAV